MMTDATEPTKHVRALMRGLSLLACFRSDRRELTFVQLMREAELDKATAFRMLHCLMHEGFLTHDAQTGRYSVGTKVLTIAAAYNGPHALVEVSQPLINELARASNQTATVAIIEKGQVVQIAIAYPDRSLRRDTSVGERYPAHCTSLGKAILADWPETDVWACATEHGLSQYTPTTKVDMESLLADLRMTRERGYAFDDEEYLPGVRCVAAPIRHQGGPVIAAVNVSGPAGEFDAEHVATYVRLVGNVADAIGRRVSPILLTSVTPGS